MNTKLKTNLLLAALLTFAATAATAATQRTNFRNDTTVNHLFLFAEDTAALPGPEIEFTALDLRNDFSSWTIDTFTPALAIFHGGDVAPNRGRFRLTFDYHVPQVSFQWAEVLFDTGTSTYTSVTGSAHYDSARPWARWTFDNVFSAANQSVIDAYFGSPAPAPVPLPNSMVMLLSAAAFLGFSRRHTLAQAI